MAMPSWLDRESITRSLSERQKGHFISALLYTARPVRTAKSREHGASEDSSKLLAPCSMLQAWCRDWTVARDRSKMEHTMTLFGILNVNKRAGRTSRRVVDQIERFVRPAKAGHAGTLDPLATGVL